MKKTIVTIAITVGSDDETQAEQCVESALTNLMGGDLQSFEVLDVKSESTTTS